MTDPVFPTYAPTVRNAVVEAARRYGEHDCVVTPRDRLTYAGLDLRSRTLAARLVADGVRKGSRVALLCPNGVMWVIGWVAITRIGAVMVPVSTFYKGPELARFLRHADVSHLLGVSRFLATDFVAELEENVPELTKQQQDRLMLTALPQLRRVMFWDERSVAWAQGGYGDGFDGPSSEAARDVARAMEDDVTPADPMMLMYTSGATAEPKGVLHSHGAATRHAVNMAAWSGWLQSYRVWTPLPLFWIGGFHSVLFRCLAVGACYLTQERFDPSQALAFISKEKVTHVVGWATSITALAQTPDFANADLSAIIGGSLYDARPPDRRPSSASLVCNSLGMTETCGPYCAPSEHDDRCGVPEGYEGAYGRVVPGIEVRIADFETGALLPDGEQGEVVVRGYSVMMGIHRRERADNFDAAGWFHTGDRGYFRDGWMFYAGRDSDSIKTSGTNVAAAEVEAVLTEHPALAQAFVFGVHHETRGQDVVALVVRRSETAAIGVDSPQLAGWLRERLSSFKVPRRFHFIDSSDVVWLPSQKIDRRAMRSLAESLDNPGPATGGS